jgi:molybdopterin/thiamine biosynthesis adenylyltransferase
MLTDPHRAWIMTDLALADLDEHLGRPEPERGAALVGPAGTRLVTGVVPDPVPGQRANYWHSGVLDRNLKTALANRPGLTYKGTAHSHPAGMAGPSGPDAKAFRSTILGNPHLSEMLFPIVVGVTTDRLAELYRGEHLVGLEKGTLAPFGATVVGRSTTVFRVPLTVLPAQQSAAAVAEATGWHVGGIDWVAGTGGVAWLMLTWTSVAGDPNPVATVLLPTTFPLGAPLIRSCDAGLFTSPAWNPAGDHPAQLIAALAPSGAGVAVSSARVAQAPGGDAHAPVQEEDEADIPDADAELMLARLAHHLPDRGGWHVAVLGAGSVGSTMCESLVRSGISSLTLVDPDTVDLPNLSRSVYLRSDVGRAKVDALADRVRAIRADAEVRTFPCGIDEWLLPDPATDCSNLDSIDLVVLATDDMVAELAVNAQTYPRNIPMVSAKLFAKADAGEVLIVEPSDGTPCLRCLTGSRGAPAGRAVDYGSGQLIAELALGPDIAGVSLRAVKVALALLSNRRGDGPLSDWIAPMLNAKRTTLLTSNVADWGIFATLDPGSLGMDGPYQALWVSLREDETTLACPVCGLKQPAGQRGADALDFASAVPDQGAFAAAQ